MDSINIDGLVMEACRECVDETEEALEQDCREAGERAKRLLKQRSRERTGAFKKGWTATTTTDETGTECVVHNKVYQLTHLLEKGHVIKNQTGKVYGKVPGDGVVEAVFREVSAQFGNGGE